MEKWDTQGDRQRRQRKTTLPQKETPNHFTKTTSLKLERERGWLELKTRVCFNSPTSQVGEDEQEMNVGLSGDHDAGH